MNWQLLTDSIVGAHARSHDRHLEPLRRLGTAVPADGQGIGIVYLLLILVLKERVAEQVNPAALRQVAAETYEAWAPLIGRPRSALEAVFLSPFELNPDDEAVVGTELMVHGTAALGILLQDPTADVARFRPFVDEWWQDFGAAAQAGADIERRPGAV
ncbi:MAG TPA: hypothetical protein VHB18_01555 [Mycobacteriales bacterium]|nr:hypothetical protein [Mycobacteriales bacterium]